MGIVALHGIEVYGKIGVTAEERKVGRTFLVDVEVHASLQKVSRRDAIEDVLNYEIISKAVHHRLAKEYKLLEAACHSIAEEILEKIPGIDKMIIRIHKLSPLMKGNIRAAVVEWCFPEDY